MRLSDFKKITIFNQDLWVKGGFSHGWFSKGEYVQAPFLHEKYLYIRKNISNHSSFTLGLVHQAMWAGETEKHGKQPQSFSDYLRVVIPRPASKSGFIGEQVNILGNHLGVWDVSYTINRKSKSFKLYYQHPFEDKSGAYQHFFDELKNKKLPVNSFDGLFGIEVKNNDSMISSLLYEYINTMYHHGFNMVATCRKRAFYLLTTC